MFKLNVSQSVSPISMLKTSCASENIENKTKRKRRKRNSSKQNDKQVNNGVLRVNRDFVHFSDLDTFSSISRTKHSGVIWKKKGSSNTSNVDLSSVSHPKLNKDFKRYSRKDFLSCNNAHLRETSSAYVCNDAMNVSCNSRLYDSFDENNLFIFDDESVRNSQVNKMHFRKRPNASVNVPYRSKLNNSSSSIMRKWIPKLQPLAEPVDKWIPKVKRLPKMKFEKGHLCSACEQGQIHRKHHKSKTAFSSNKLLYLLHMDWCGLMHIESINGKRYVLVVVDDYSRYTWVFFLYSKDEASEIKLKGDIGVFVGYSKESAAFKIYNKQTRKIHESVNVNFDEISEMASKQFSLESGLSNLNKTGKSSSPSIMKSSTTNVETSNVEIPSNEEEIFHESSESFQEESSSSSLNDDVHQSLEEVAIHSSDTQSVSYNIVPNVDEDSTSHNVFNDAIYLNTPDLFLRLVDERLLLPPKQTPPEADKNSCTRLLMDLLTQKGYTEERDDIINIVSLRKHSSLDTHINPFNEDEIVTPKRIAWYCHSGNGREGVNRLNKWCLVVADGGVKGAGVLAGNWLGKMYNTPFLNVHCYRFGS
nr:retrovirus-related Pol polyprotein from transposon TNT 1-94 [Tanacetum cinerariifolium]